MTLAIAWVRTVKGCQELIFASDSRLCGGMRWDQGPKIMTLPRSDCAISFAGESFYPYPLMLQLCNAISSYSRSQDGAMDLHDLRGHALKVFNSMRDSIHYDADPNGKKDIELLFGGYSWIRKKFSIWRFHYKLKEKKIAFQSAGISNGIDKVIFAGDWAKEAKNRLNQLIRAKYGNGMELYKGNGFDMEPFEVLRDLLRENSKRADVTIGGPPQIVKVYQHMNCKPIGVYWPDLASNVPTILGRTAFPFETIDYWVMDPDTFRTKKHK